jgi:hypothetical protein
MCDPPLVFAILEVLTLLRRACENEFIDEYNPTYEFCSDRTGITLQLTDSYTVRNEILAQLQRNANNWFELALGRAPVELQSTLQVRLFRSACPIKPIRSLTLIDRNTFLGIRPLDLNGRSWAPRWRSSSVKPSGQFNDNSVRSLFLIELHS